MKIKKLLAGMLAGVLACGMLLTTGCGTTDENAVFATMGDTQVTYGVANFFTRFQQAVYDGYYNTDSTKDFWTQDMYGLGYTLEDMIKSNTLSSIEEYYRLDAHAADYDVALTDEQSAAIDEAAQSFMDSNTQEALEQIGATSVDVVKEMLRVYTVRNMVYDAIIDETDLSEITMESCAQKTYSYVSFSYDSDDDDAKKEAKSNAQAFLAAALSSDGMEAAAEDQDLTVSSGSYGVDDEDVDEAIQTAADELAEGEIAKQIVKTDDAFYVIRLDSNYDEDATQTEYDSQISTAKQNHYSEVYEGYQEESTFDYDEKMWEKIQFNDLFTFEEASGDATDASADASGDVQ